MRIKSLASCVMPTFRRGNWLPDRIEEILGQSYKNLELIIVNDASDDDTDKILYGYRNEPKIRVINLRENSGSCSLPRNIAVSHSKGEFISPCDDDVYDEKHKLEFLVEALEKNPNAVLAYGNRHDWISGIDYPKVIENWKPSKMWGVDNSQILYRSNVYIKIPFLYFSRADDWNLCKELEKLGDFVHVNRFVSRYIFHNANRSNIKISDEEQIELNKELKIKAETTFAEYFNPDFLNSFDE
jgi:glycosyltransferase involved in cell wall biosynthesis